MNKKRAYLVFCDYDSFKPYYKLNADVLSKYDLIDRLQINDINKEKPTDEIINFHITKRIRSFPENRKTFDLYVHTEVLNLDFINKYKSLFNPGICEITHYLYYKNTKISLEISSHFNEILLI